MRGKTRGEARDELVKAGIRGERLQNIQPHKVGRPFLIVTLRVWSCSGSTAAAFLFVCLFVCFFVCRSSRGTNLPILLWYRR